MSSLNNFYMNVGEIAIALQVSRGTVRRWIDRGDLKVSFVLPSKNPQSKIHIKEVKAFLKRNKMPSFESFLELNRVEFKVKTVSVKMSNVKKIKKKNRIKKK